jgi:hypothetical protein
VNNRRRDSIATNCPLAGAVNSRRSQRGTPAGGPNTKPRAYPAGTTP